MNLHIALLWFIMLTAIRPATGQVSCNEFPKELCNKLKSQEELVKEVAEYASYLHANRAVHVKNCQCTEHVCSTNLSASKCTTDLRLSYDYCEVPGVLFEKTTIIRTPPGIDPSELSDSIKENACTYKHIVDILREHPEEKFGGVYLGTTDGHTTRFPAIGRESDKNNGDPLWNYCKPYDPRERPWFIGASTGPKDIVLVVDKSFSMGEVRDNRSSKWEVTRCAVKKILKTFTFVDFVNVVVFNDDAVQLWTKSNLARGTKQNLDRITKELNNHVPSGRTNFAAAFDVAFDLLTISNCEEPKICSNCQKIILFLTDGKDTSVGEGDSIRPSEMLAFINDKQIELEKETGQTASIFTYSMTADADDSIPRQVACSNQGAWAYIGPSTDPLDAMLSYYRFIAAGRKSESPAWIEPFEDASGIGIITTVAVPFYARLGDNEPEVFLGVVGHTVGLFEYEVSGFDVEEVLDIINARSEVCGITRDSSCDLQVYRDVDDSRSVCPDPFPPLDSDSVKLCYEFDGKFYKRFDEPEVKGRAQTRCEEDGGQAVIINDEAELSFVANLADSDGSWTDAELDSDGKFSWSDRDVPPIERGSDYWGLGEPVPREECVAIDRRGIVGNLFTADCSERKSFICKYATSDSCRAGVKEIPDRGYFSVPPLKECTSVIHATRSTKEVAKLSTDDVMCELGLDHPKTNKERLCCPLSRPG